ncbi:MAG TPA: flavodoxin family protein [Rhizomicrobium sp.]|jgi:multimeric flavodoxin WrbA|nr:flavodoxin family protein [Rhizomicrobium sp.]
MPLTAFALNCTLKTGHEKSSTDKLLGEVLAELKKHGCEGEIVRAANFNIKPGVKSDEGKGDDWPGLRKKILAADIFILGTPIWMGQPCSIAKRVCERMDAFLDEKDDHDRMPSYGKVAAVAVVGNEDGAHHVSAEMFQTLNDVGFTIPANAITYWVGEAMGNKNYVDLKTTPKVVKNATQMLARNTTHLAQLLKTQTYPGKD